MALVNFSLPAAVSNISPNLTYVPNILDIITDDSDPVNDSILLLATEPPSIENGTGSAEEMPEWKVKLNKAFSLTMVISMMIVTLGMGSHVNFREVFRKLQAPLPIVLGVCGQYVLMPAVAFGIARSFKLEPYISLGALIVSCTPGGTFSNVFTFWADGDVALSLVLTTFSTILSFGAMPLNIWIYSSRIMGPDSGDVTVPFVNILTILAFFMAPFLGGMTIRHFSERIAVWITKIANVVGNLSVLTILIIILLLFWEALASATAYIHASVLIMPLIGMAVIYPVGRLFRWSDKVCKTIAIETAARNVVLAMGVVVLSFSDFQVRNKILLYPTLFAIYMFSEIILIILAYRLYKYKYQTKKSVAPNEEQT